MGCGNGRHLKSLGFRLLNAKIIGIDQSGEEITKLQDEFSDHICKNQNSYEFSIGDVRNIDIEDNSQDLVICSEVLEHVPNFKDVLKNATEFLNLELLCLLVFQAIYRKVFVGNIPKNICKLLVDTSEFLKKLF